MSERISGSSNRNSPREPQVDSHEQVRHEDYPREQARHDGEPSALVRREGAKDSDDDGSDDDGGPQEEEEEDHDDGGDGPENDHEDDRWEDEQDHQCAQRRMTLFRVVLFLLTHSLISYWELRDTDILGPALVAPPLAQYRVCNEAKWTMKEMINAAFFAQNFHAFDETFRYAHIVAPRCDHTLNGYESIQLMTNGTFQYDGYEEDVVPPLYFLRGLTVPFGATVAHGPIQLFLLVAFGVMALETLLSACCERHPRMRSPLYHIVFGLWGISCVWIIEWLLGSARMGALSDDPICSPMGDCAEVLYTPRFSPGIGYTLWVSNDSLKQSLAQLIVKNCAGIHFSRDNTRLFLRFHTHHILVEHLQSLAGSRTGLLSLILGLTLVQILLVHRRYRDAWYEYSQRPLPLPSLREPG